MRKLHAAFPGDLDVCALFAEAIMNRTPWQLWGIAASDPAEGADTEEAIAVLETAFSWIAGAHAHRGFFTSMCMHVQLVEMSPHPERALRAGDALSGLVPDAGHLLHMGTQLDVLCGQYHDVVARNRKACEADERYLAHAGPDNFYTVYRCHNYHFIVYGAMFVGQYRAAKAAAEGLKRTLHEPVLRPMADWFEAFYGMDLHVMIRFGRREELTGIEPPADRELYTATAALTHYVRGVAHAALGHVEAAEAEQAAFVDARGPLPESRMLFNNTCQDVLGVAAAKLEGEIASRRGEFAAAFAALERAVETDDTLPYDEPWGWMQPVRHALGALLLEQGRIDEAEAVCRADLGLDGKLARACQHPGNMWALHGLQECLVRRGERAEATLITQLLALASARGRRTAASLLPLTACGLSGAAQPAWNDRRGEASADRQAV